MVARQVRDRGRFVEASGEAYLPDGQVVAEATGLFLKLRPDEVEDLRRAIWPDAPRADGPRAVGPSPASPSPSASPLPPGEGQGEGR